MTLALLFALLSACGDKPPPPPPAATGWVSGVKTWYCGTEPLAADKPDGTRAFTLKLEQRPDAIMGLYAVREGSRGYIGTLTRFVSTQPRSATLRHENDQRQKGDAKLQFSENFRTLELEWQVGSQLTPTRVTLTESQGAEGCAAGSLLR